MDDSRYYGGPASDTPRPFTEGASVARALFPARLPSSPLQQGIPPLGVSIAMMLRLHSPNLGATPQPQLPLACLREEAQAILTPSQPMILGSSIITNPHKLALTFLLMLNLTTIALHDQESLAMFPEERVLQGSTKVTSKEARGRSNVPSAVALLHNTTMLAGSARRC